MKKLVCVVSLTMLAMCVGCITDENAAVFHREYPGIRNENREIPPLGREGLAFSRVATSPFMIPAAFASGFTANDHHDVVNRTAYGVFDAIIEAPIMMTQEIVVGLAEMLSCHQFKSLYYPWEHYSMKMESEQTELRIRAKEEYRREHPNPNLEFFGEIVSGAAQGAIEGASQAAVGGDGTAAGAGGGASSDGGYGSISGPSSLASGSSGVYRLYVEGKKVNADWHQNGTSISVYGSGDHARAMGGNPPIKRGRYKTGIRATYNGKTYTKTIYVVK